MHHCLIRLGEGGKDGGELGASPDNRWVHVYASAMMLQLLLRYMYVSGLVLSIISCPYTKRGHQVTVIGRGPPTLAHTHTGYTGQAKARCDTREENRPIRWPSSADN